MHRAVTVGCLTLVIQLTCLPNAGARPAAAILADYKTTQQAAQDRQSQLDQLGADLDSLDDLPPAVTVDPPARPTPPVVQVPAEGGLTLLGITSGAPDPRQLKVRDRIEALDAIERSEPKPALQAAVDSINRNLDEIKSLVSDYKREAGNPDRAEADRLASRIRGLLAQRVGLDQELTRTWEDFYTRLQARPDYISAYADYQAAVAASPNDASLQGATMARDRAGHFENLNIRRQQFQDWISKNFP